MLTRRVDANTRDIDSPAHRGVPMSEFATLIAPLLAMMLIPVWIPIIAMVGGALYDVVTPERADPLEERRRARAARAASMTLAETD